MTYIAILLPTSDGLSIHQAARSFFLFLLNAARALYFFWPPWPFPQLNNTITQPLYPALPAGQDQNTFKRLHFGLKF